jgi:perosamine synthetase
MVARRRTFARRYQELLSGIPGLMMADDPPYGETNYQSFWLLLPEESAVGRDHLLQLLADAGISARRGIMAAHLEPAYAGANPSLPVTELLSEHSLILPLFHEMTQSQQERVVSVVTSALTNSTSALSL